MRRSKSEYEVTVSPDGSWHVAFSQRAMCHWTPRTIATGAAEDQRRGEIAARMAIEDDRAQRAKARVEASMVQRFTVPA